MAIVVSGGNNGPDYNSMNFPSYLDGVIAVGGYDVKGNKEWEESSRGPVNS